MLMKLSKRIAIINRIAMILSLIDNLNFYPEKSKERLKQNIHQIIKPAANTRYS